MDTSLFQGMYQYRIVMVASDSTHFEEAAIPSAGTFTTLQFHMGDQPSVQEVRRDLFDLLRCFSPQQVRQLRQKVLEGNIDGGLYGPSDETDRVAPRCLVGWLGVFAQRPAEFYGDGDRPLEQWVRGITPGVTPSTNLDLADILAMIEEWLARQPGVGCETNFDHETWSQWPLVSIASEQILRALN